MLLLLVAICVLSSSSSSCFMAARFSDRGASFGKDMKTLNAHKYEIANILMCKWYIFLCLAKRVFFGRVQVM